MRYTIHNGDKTYKIGSATYDYGDGSKNGTTNGYSRTNGIYLNGLPLTNATITYYSDGNCNCAGFPENANTTWASVPKTSLGKITYRRYESCIWENLSVPENTVMAMEIVKHNESTDEFTGLYLRFDDAATTYTLEQAVQNELIKPLVFISINNNRNNHAFAVSPSRIYKASTGSVRAASNMYVVWTVNTGHVCNRCWFYPNCPIKSDDQYGTLYTLNEDDYRLTINEYQKPWRINNNG